MKVPAEIAEKAKRYQELNKEAQRLCSLRTSLWPRNQRANCKTETSIAVRAPTGTAATRLSAPTICLWKEAACIWAMDMIAERGRHGDAL